MTAHGHISRPDVFLRHPTAMDRDEFIALRRASRAFLKPWDATPPGPRIDWYGPSGFERFLATSRLESSLRFLVCELERGTILGSMGVSNISRGAFQSCTVGYWIGQAHAGRGYMTQALALTLHYCFRTLKLHRVEANVIPGNRPSTALVTRLGFRPEGIGKRYIRINNRWQDHARWAMTIEDFRPLCARAVIPFTQRQASAAVKG